MKGASRGLVLTIAALSIRPAVAADDEHDRAPTVRIPILDATAQIDGRLQEPIWQKAALCKGFALLDGQTPASQSTEARIFGGKDGLYFGFVCKQPNLPVAEVTRRDGDVYTENLTFGNFTHYDYGKALDVAEVDGNLKVFVAVEVDQHQFPDAVGSQRIGRPAAVTIVP